MANARIAVFLPRVAFATRAARWPQGGQIARGTCDLVPGVALLDVDEQGHAEYSGETKICWDGQYTDTDENDDPILICPDDHQWAARIFE